MQLSHSYIKKNKTLFLIVIALIFDWKTQVYCYKNLIETISKEKDEAVIVTPIKNILEKYVYTPKQRLTLVITESDCCYYLFKEIQEYFPLFNIEDSFTARTKYISSELSGSQFNVTSKTYNEAASTKTLPSHANKCDNSMNQLVVPRYLDKYMKSIEMHPQPSVIIVLGKKSEKWLKCVLLSLKMSHVWRPDAHLVVVLTNRLIEEVSLREALQGIPSATILRILEDSSLETLEMRGDLRIKEAMIISHTCSPEMRGYDKKVGYRPYRADAHLVREIHLRIPELWSTQCQPVESMYVGGVLPNGTITGHLAAIASGRVAFFGTAILRVTEWTRYVRFLQPHSKDDLCAYVKRSEVIPLLEATTRAFQVETWMAAAAVLLAFALASALMQVLEKNNSQLLDMPTIGMNVLFNTSRIALTGSFSETRSGRAGWLSVLLSAGAVVLSCCAAGAFTAFLAAPPFGPNFASLAEVFASVRTVYIFEAYKRMLVELMHESGDAKGGRGPKVESNSYTNMAKERIIRGEPLAAISSDSYTIDSLLNPKFWRNGRLQLHKVPECVLSPAFPSLTAPTWAAWVAARADSIAQRCLSAGLTLKWERDARREGQLNFGAAPAIVFSGPYPTEPAPQPYPLKITHIVAAFQMLGYGLLSSTIAFILEILLRLAKMKLGR